MEKGKKVIFWDFDGTLASFTGWRKALMDTLDEYEPGHNTNSEHMRPFLREGFPWHNSEVPHTHITTSDEWWKTLEPVFIKCYMGVGYYPERATVLAQRVREHIIKPGRYMLYEDAISVLAELKEKGWRHLILSNHIPELPQIVSALALSPYIDFCITSGITGYEKPHLQAFCIALETAGNPHDAWMVGDNLTTDILGAEAAGIRAILVHRPPTEVARYSASTLSDVIKIVESNPE
jgi:putative hydrolase of the HAD superfamily